MKYVIGNGTTRYFKTLSLIFYSITNNPYFILSMTDFNEKEDWRFLVTSNMTNSTLSTYSNAIYNV